MSPLRQRKASVLPLLSFFTRFEAFERNATHLGAT
jgi:hypothetical protein